MGGGRPGFYAKDGTFLGGKSIGGRKGKEITKKVFRWVEDVAEPREDLLKVLVPYVRGRGIDMLDEWLLQVVSAKGDAENPPQESADHWVVALIGNLVWAASCFVPGAGIVKAATGPGYTKLLRDSTGTGLVKALFSPTEMTSVGKKLYATMAVGGAVVGSGTVQKLVTDDSGNPTGKDAVAMMLNDQRKKLGEVFENSINGFVGELMKNKEFQYDNYAADENNFLRAVDEALWQSIFPSIGYEDFNAIYQQSMDLINRALISFKDQYKVWSQARRTHAEAPYRDRYGQYVNLDGGKRYREKLEEYERRIPFKPALNFEAQ
jgi:hypothetical protein